ncbi:hypothetical protein NXK88_001954 [Enterococcus hirae]|uniref:hypothetical protein n=1 Tax=Enterococcus hirae TaxID=1354 RepID=UPI002073D5DB|nr:hypothetical protein [Enterococcus hirae]EMF0202723.1 hypothetical protein [Enterococcus hirae]
MKKYYRVKTQEAYDGLMSFLEVQGFRWASGDKPTGLNYFGVRSEDIVIAADEKFKYLLHDSYDSYHDPKRIAKFIEWTPELSQSVSAFIIPAIQEMVNTIRNLSNNFETIKKEPVYEIPLSSLETTDGEAQYLSYKDKKWFASRRNTQLKQRFTETELKEKVPEFYQELAKRV